MKLYYTPGTCSLAPHIILKETKSPFTAVKTDIRAKKVEDGSDFFKVNPNGYVPALMLDDGTVLTEASVLVQYIADKAGAKELAPAPGTLDRYKLMSLLNFISTEVHKTLGVQFNPKMPAEGKTALTEKFLERMKVVDAQLGRTAFLAGNSFTIADAYLFTVLQWTNALKIDISSFKNVGTYLEKIRARPAVQDALRAEAA